MRSSPGFLSLHLLDQKVAKQCVSTQDLNLVIAKRLERRSTKPTDLGLNITLCKVRNENKLGAASR